MGDTGSLALGGAVAAFAVFTKTELLLPLVGGVFVVEALSVIIQVVSFKRTGRRVFLMAPIHHHFEMKAWSRDEDHGALLDRGRALRRRVVRAVLPAVRPVPVSGALPDRALVVGAARSGVAAAGALAARGVEVRAARRRRRCSCPRCAEGVELALGDAGPGGARARRRRAREVARACPAEAPVVQAARAAGVPVWSEVELGFRLLPAGARLVGVTGTNGKTTVTELVGAMLRAAGADAVVAGNVGVALSGIAGDVPAGRRSSCASCRRSSSRTSSTPALRRGGADQRDARPPRPARHDGGVWPREAAHLRAPARRRTPRC